MFIVNEICNDRNWTYVTRISNEIIFVLFFFFYYNITSKIWNEFRALVCFEMHFAPFDIFSTWKLIFLVKWNYLGTKKVRIVELLVFSFKVSLLLSIFILNNVHMKMHWIFNQYYIKIHYNLTIDTL